MDRGAPLPVSTGIALKPPQRTESSSQKTKNPAINPQSVYIEGLTCYRWNIYIYIKYMVL